MIASTRPSLRIALVALLLVTAGCETLARIEKPVAEEGETEPETDADAAPPPAFHLTPLEKIQLLFPALLKPRNVADDRCVRSHRVIPPQWLEEAIESSTCTPELRAIIEDKPQEKGDDTPAIAQSRLTAAALCDDEVAIARQIELGADPNKRDACGATALVVAASAGNRDAIHALLDAGAKPNLSTQQGRWSRTALLAALISGDFVSAGTILDAGANANAETDQGRSALMFAATSGDEELVRDLLHRHADACHADGNGLTAVEIALAKGEPKVFSLVARAARKCSQDARKRS